MLFLKLLDLKVKAFIVVALAFAVASLILYVDKWTHAAAHTVRQSQHEMRTMREWRLK